MGNLPTDPGRPTPTPQPIPSPTPGSGPLYRQAIDYLNWVSSYTCETFSNRLTVNPVQAQLRISWKRRTTSQDLRMEIIDNGNAAEQTNILNGVGTVLLYRGGDTVQLKLPGWFAPLTLPVGDPRLLLPSGQRFDQGTPSGILQRFLDPGVTLRELGEVTWEGNTVTEYQLESTATGGTRRELIGIDPDRRIPAFYVLADPGSDLQHPTAQMFFRQFQENPPLGDGLFLTP